MLTTQVALVPLEPQDDAAANTELLWVAAALQTQVTRDFGPIWGVRAVVTPFLKLEDVPPHYLPIILSDEPLARGNHGFHLGADGRPFALVFRGTDWSVTASHELMEMTLDPSGSLTTSAPSVADDDKKRGGDPPDYTPQGIVDYIVEPCDPVEEAERYEIDGVPVSDFVTPAYYEPCAAPGVAVPGVRYSFCGSVTEPLTISDGGYLSWRTLDPPNSVWQARATGSGLAVERLKDDDDTSPSPPGTPSDDFVSRFSRDQVAVRTSKRGRQDPAGTAPVSLTNPYAASWKTCGERFTHDVKAINEYLSEPPPPTLRDVINALKEIRDTMGSKTTGPAFVQLLNGYNIRTGNTLTLHRNNPPDVNEIIEVLEKQERISNILDSNAADPDFACWTCYLMP